MRSGNLGVYLRVGREVVFTNGGAAAVLALLAKEDQMYRVRAPGVDRYVEEGELLRFPCGDAQVAARFLVRKGRAATLVVSAPERVRVDWPGRYNAETDGTKQKWQAAPPPERAAG